jgi:hypothetical protein
MVLAVRPAAAKLNNYFGIKAGTSNAGVISTASGLR